MERIVKFPMKLNSSNIRKTAEDAYYEAVQFGYCEDLENLVINSCDNNWILKFSCLNDEIKLQKYEEYFEKDTSYFVLLFIIYHFDKIDLQKIVKHLLLLSESNRTTKDIVNEFASHTNIVALIEHMPEWQNYLMKKACE